MELSGRSRLRSPTLLTFIVFIIINIIIIVVINIIIIVVVIIVIIILLANYFLHEIHTISHYVARCNHLYSFSLSFCFLMIFRINIPHLLKK